MPPRLVLTALGLLLLAACAGKAYALGTRPIVRAPTLWGTRWFQTGMVEAELFLGLWLLSGLYVRQARLLALVCFLAFFELNFHLHLSGEKSCPCFGSTRIDPGQTALLDLGAVIALLACKPFHDKPQLTIQSHPQRLRVFLILFGLVGIPLIVLLGGRRDPTFLAELREDRALQERMAFQVNHPSNGMLLALLQKHTGLTMTADKGLAEEQTSFGKARFQKISACSVMEQMLGKQSTRTFWVRTDEGYRLARAPLLQRWLPWILTVALFALVSAPLVWLDRSMRAEARAMAASQLVGNRPSASAGALDGDDKRSRLTSPRRFLWELAALAIVNVLILLLRYLLTH